MLAPNTKHHSLGVSRAGTGTRLWLEGVRLQRNGFTLGTQCARHWAPNRLVITPCDGAIWDVLDRDCRTTIAGTIDRPIIDITGKLVAACFPTGQVMVTWARGSIVIEGV